MHEFIIAFISMIIQKNNKIIKLVFFSIIIRECKLNPTKFVLNTIRDDVASYNFIRHTYGQTNVFARLLFAIRF